MAESAASGCGPLGDLLRRYRAAANLTQEELANRSGLSVPAISMLERGVRRAPRPSTVELLAGALNLDTQERRALVSAARGNPMPHSQPVQASGGSTAGDLPSPNQLPPDTEEFTGRGREASALRALLTDEQHATVRVTAISGRGGVGKSTLAVHVAHSLREHFPDGQLYVNLRGVEPNRREPAEVLASLLRCLGVEGRSIPDGLDARAELYRSRLADRRVLVMLDDAANERQVRPLLPGSPTCAVVVTSRAGLVGLDGARHVELGMLTTDEAVELLGRVAGADRIRAEPAAARQVARLCDRLPLAVRIAGARLAARPYWQPSRLVERLLDERRRLDELAQGDLEVRASIALSYTGLGTLEQVAFRRLALLTGPDFPGWVAAALLDLPPGQADDVVERLDEARLLGTSRVDRAGRPRFRFHDLVRLYARERDLQEDLPSERHAALQRALQGWRQLSVEAERRLVGSAARPRAAMSGWVLDAATVDGLLADPLGWFEAERQSLVAMVVQANEANLGDAAYDLTASLATYFSMRGYFDDWRNLHELLLATARRTANRPAEAVLERGLGDLYTLQDRYDDALVCFQRARRTFHDTGDRCGEAASLNGRGFVLRVRGRFDEAISCYQKVLDLLSGVDDAQDRIAALLGTGTVRTDQGRFDEARSSLRVARAEAESLGYHLALVRITRALALTHLRQGRHEEARALLEQSTEMGREVGDRPGVVHAVYWLGDIDRLCGRWTEADATLCWCLAHYREFGDRFNEAHTLQSLGELYLAQGRLDRSIDCLRQSDDIFGDLRLPLGRARTLAVLADALAAAGDGRAARGARWKVRTMVGDRGSPSEGQDD